MGDITVFAVALVCGLPQLDLLECCVLSSGPGNSIHGAGVLIFTV